MIRWRRRDGRAAARPAGSAAARSRPVAAALAVALATALAGGAAAQPADGTFASDQRFVPRDGAVLYRSICQGCHMPDAKGATGAGKYPALAGNDRLEAAGYAIFIVLNGQKGMPGFADMLDDAQIAAVITYIRTQFGNAYRDAVTADDVKAVR
jgi:mono/diheme cytochrome c family protein